MKVYWDSSALVAATMEVEVRQRLLEPDQFSRKHALAEVFSTLTGSRLGFRWIRRMPRRLSRNWQAR